MSYPPCENNVSAFTANQTTMKPANDTKTPLCTYQLIHSPNPPRQPTQSHLAHQNPPSSASLHTINTRTTQSSPPPPTTFTYKRKFPTERNLTPHRRSPHPKPPSFARQNPALTRKIRGSRSDMRELSSLRPACMHVPHNILDKRELILLIQLQILRRAWDGWGVCV